MGKTLNIAHRGGAGLKPENTLAAFSAAIARGCDGAELDVQLSADGMVVVHHDLRLNPKLARDKRGWLTGRTPAIKDLSYAMLEAFEIGQPDPASDYPKDHPRLSPVEGERIPTLEAVAALARKASHPFFLFVELKTADDPDSGDPIKLADEVLAVMRSQLDRTIFVGFDWRGLMRVKEREPKARCWFSTDQLAGDVKPIIRGIAHAKADGWFPHYANMTEETALYARSLGLKVGAWTVNEPAEMKKLLALELDAICTDRPDLLDELKK